MRKVKLSDEQLSQILRLRQTGASWLRIQRETGIPRRSAQKIYEAWTSSQAQEELKAARKEVATDEFKKHLDDLLVTAQTLVDYLPDSLIVNETRSSVEIIDNIWRIDPRSKEKNEDMIFPYENNLERKQRRIVRQNKLLFDSLKEHTRDKLQWQVLDQWRNEWDRAIETQSKMKANAEQMVLMILDGQRKDIKKRLHDEASKDKIFPDVINGVYEAVWRSVQAGVPEDAPSFVRMQETGGDNIAIYFGKKESMAILNFSDRGLAEDVYKVCIQAAESIGKSDIARLLLDIKICLQRKAFEIEVMLDAIRLRPLILRTRCDICPA